MPISLPPGEDPRVPYASFAFHVSFEVASQGGAGAATEAFGAAPTRFAPAAHLVPELIGGFSEISGLEAVMEHKVIKPGGRNYGAVVRAGPVTFGTVVMKRGVIKAQPLWQWWTMFAGSDGAADALPIPENRCNVLIGLIRNRDEGDAALERKIRLGWRLRNAMPVKFRVGDLNAKGGDVAIEEIHLVHEGLEMKGVAA
jgi:phage tail-like protein